MTGVSSLLTLLDAWCLSVTLSVASADKPHLQVLFGPTPTYLRLPGTFLSRHRHTSSGQRSRPGVAIVSNSEMRLSVSLHRDAPICVPPHFLGEHHPRRSDNNSFSWFSLPAFPPTTVVTATTAAGGGEPNHTHTPRKENTHAHTAGAHTLRSSVVPIAVWPSPIVPGGLSVPQEASRGPSVHSGGGAGVHPPSVLAPLPTY